MRSGRHGPTLNDLGLNAKTARDLVGRKLDEPSVPVLEYRAVDGCSYGSAKARNDDRQETIVEACRPGIVAEGMTSEAAMRVQLGDELLVAFTEHSHQPTGLVRRRYNPIALWMVVHAIEPRYHHLRAGHDSTQVDEGLRSKLAALGAEPCVATHRLESARPDEIADANHVARRRVSR